MSEEDKILKIISHYGINNQQRKLQEEVFELQEIIRDYEFSKDNFPKQHKICEERFLKHIAEELADVMVMLEQFRLYYGIPVGNIKEVMEYKVKRQIERIENESN